MAEPAPEEDTVRDFTCQVSDRLGSGPVATGSFGEIHRCTIDSGMEVAVKVFKISTRPTDQLMKKMDRELRVWLRLKHPTIVPLLGTARIKPPLLALVSEWMSSGTLINYLEGKATTITASARTTLVKGIASGLVYLHSENVIHGDLHPGNVLIDDSGNPRIADFGLATVAEDPELQWATTTVERGLHSRWHAPEVIGIDNDPERPTFKSDIYSFGSVMFFILSGDIPWKEKKSSVHICIELFKGVIHARPCNIIHCQWDLIEKCWSRKPGNCPVATEVLHLSKHFGLEQGMIPANLTYEGCLWVDELTNEICGNSVPAGLRAILDHLKSNHGICGGEKKDVECRWALDSMGVCGKEFQRRNVSRHMTAHLHLRFYCDHCRKDFARADLLREHVRNQHQV